MKKHTVIITAGTSILSNRHNCLYDFFTGNSLENIHETRLKLRQYFESKPEINLNVPISAEITLFSSLMREKRLIDKPRVILLHSATNEGHFSAAMVKETLKSFSNLNLIELVEINDLNMQEGNLAQVQKGMSSFIDELTNLFEQYQDQKEFVLFAPIGGYKSMTMLSHLVASTFQFESWYQFEQSNFPIKIPLIPVEIDKQQFKEAPLKPMLQQFYLENHFSFKEAAILSDLPLSLQIKVKEYPNVFYTLEDDTDAIVSISPLIKRQLNSMKDTFLPDVYFAKNIKLHKQQVYERFIGAWPVSKNPKEYTNTYEHEYDLEIGTSQNNWHVFRAKSGDALRVIYYLDRANTNVYIKEIMLHDEYEMLLSNDKNKQVFREKLLAPNTVNEQDYTLYKT